MCSKKSISRLRFVFAVDEMLKERATRQLAPPSLSDIITGMDRLTLPDEQTGQSSHQRRSWRPLGLGAAWLAVILALAMAAAVLTGIAFDRLNSIGGARAYAAGEMEALATRRLAYVLFAFQMVAMAGVLVVARRYSLSGFVILPLVLPKRAVITFLLAIAGLFLISGVYGSAVYQFNRSAMSQDLGPFAGMMRTESWWLILLAAGIGAPLAEEFLFRGLLYGTLRAAPSGKVVAALVSAAAWAGLHLNYAIYGVVAIFLIGLYFAWLRERTGSLLPPIVCHGVYNSLIIVALASAPDAFL